MSAGISLCVAAVAWKRRPLRSARALVWLMVAIAWWAAGEAGISLAPGIDAKLTWLRLQYLVLPAALPLLLRFALDYAGADGTLARWGARLAWVVPILTVIAVWTNGLQHLHWRSVALDSTGSFLVFQRGPWFWVFTVAAYLTLAAAVCVLASATMRAGLQHAQARTVLVATLIPIAANVVWVTHGEILPGVDWTPMAFAVTGVLLAVATLRFGFLKVVPMARTAVIETMADGLLVIDEEGRVVDTNPALARMLGLELGRHGETADLPEPLRQALSGSPGQRQTEATVAVAGSARTFEMHVSTIAARSGRPLGRLVLLRDITERRAAEQEKERLLGDLRSASAEIRTLRGLMPICSSCRRVRDDQGYWSQIETYLSVHADVEFSHGLCPDCARRLYPNVFKEP